jgi:hypothetical protein
MSFKSYFWNEIEIKNKEVKAAIAILSSRDSTREEKISSFKTLLESESPAAQGIAFDQYFYNISLMRFGKDNPFEQFDDLLLSKARNQLRSAPVDSITISGLPIHGANYASAFGVLAHLASENDINLISPILSSFLDVEEIIFNGCLAASTSLKGSRAVYPKMFEVLSHIILSDDFSSATRTMAVDALAESLASEVEDILVKTVRLVLFPTSVYAAIALGERDMRKYRNLLEELAERLPENAPYPASDLREMLEEN